jgi:uncharacterized metal-binding protein YceD (DUF177 family)
MSEPWSRPLEVDRLADGGAEVDFAVPLAQLRGLAATGVAGSVAGRARFARAQGLALHGAATVECQRCRQPMSVPIDTVAKVALVASEADAARVPAELEPVLAPGGRTSIAELITEELLLTLPIVALHGGDEPCVAPPAGTAAGERGQETHKPFARLADLLKR